MSEQRWANPEPTPGKYLSLAANNADLSAENARLASLLEERDRTLLDARQAMSAAINEAEVLRAQLTEAREALELIAETEQGYPWYQGIARDFLGSHERPIVPSPKLGVSQSLEPATEET